MQRPDTAAGSSAASSGSDDTDTLGAAGSSAQPRDGQPTTRTPAGKRRRNWGVPGFESVSYTTSSDVEPEPVPDAASMSAEAGSSTEAGSSAHAGLPADDGPHPCDILLLEDWRRLYFLEKYKRILWQVKARSTDHVIDNCPDISEEQRASIQAAAEQRLIQWLGESEAIIGRLTTVAQQDGPMRTTRDIISNARARTGADPRDEVRPQEEVNPQEVVDPQEVVHPQASPMVVDDTPAQTQSTEAA